MKRWLGLIVTLLLLPTVGNAACTSVSSAGLALGTYTGAASTSGTGSVTVNCSWPTTFDIGTNSGLHQGGGNYNWNMTGSNGGLLHYEIWRDSAHSLLWGNTPGTDTIRGTIPFLGNSQTFSIYPRIPASTTPTPGTYNDTLTVSVYVNGATTLTTQVPVTATVPAACTVSATSLAFGVYTGALLNGTAIVTATCTNTTPYQIGADNGQNSAFIGVYAKYMIGPSGNKLRYHLYADAARSIEWGTTAGTNELAGTGTGVAQPITIYGAIGAGSYGSAPGSYSDIVTITLTY